MRGTFKVRPSHRTIDSFIYLHGATFCVVAVQNVGVFGDRIQALLLNETQQTHGAPSRYNCSAM